MSARPPQSPAHEMPAPEALRRGWCPSTLRPMETGDGWLVRLHPPGAVLSPVQLIRIAALAREHGNGLIEISARGNMQLRGVTVGSHPALVATLLAERLVDEHDGDGPQRLTLVSPLAGATCGSSHSPHPEERRSGVPKEDSCGSRASGAILRGAIPKGMAPQDEGFRDAPVIGDLIDAAALASDIESRARAILGLPPKFLIVVDGGGALSLDGFPCDLRVTAVAANAVVLGLPDGSWRGPVTAEKAGGAVATIMSCFAALHADAPTTIRRLRDLAAPELAALCELPATQPPPSRPPPRRAGLFARGTGRFAAIAALPFGRCHADVLTALGEAAAAQGAKHIRLSPWRGIACPDLDENAAQGWLDAAAALGLIVAGDDPRLSIEACAGKPACLRAEADAMADAMRLAEAAAPLMAAGAHLHVSGCVKSCAYPGRADLTLVGREGRYDVILHGGARDEPIATLDLSEILRRLQPEQDLFARLAEAASGHQA